MSKRSNKNIILEDNIDIFLDEIPHEISVSKDTLDLANDTIVLNKKYSQNTSISTVETLKIENLDINNIKKLGKDKTKKNLDSLIYFFSSVTDTTKKREIVSSIGRHNNDNKILTFIAQNVFSNITMDIVYQMYRTILYRASKNSAFKVLKKNIESYYDNEIIQRMNYFYQNKGKQQYLDESHTIKKPTIFIGDNRTTLSRLRKCSIDLIFTSPPYYNAREYSSYKSYKSYLDIMKETLEQCHCVLKEGRFIVINVSPVITKRPGREFESIRYPIHFDFHRILTDSGYYFIDEIIWIKPEYSVKNRIGGYLQTRKPLSYKPNCITESIMIYRKDAPFLLDKNIAEYKGETTLLNDNSEIDTTNCWYINPKSTKDHPAVFPEELCEKILMYYSYKTDIVLDPFAGSGTFGRVAKRLNRIPILCECNEEYLVNEVGYDVIR